MHVVAGVHSATFTFTNNCPFTVWPGTLTGAGKPQLSSTGFELAPQGSSSLDAPDGWSGTPAGTKSYALQIRLSPLKEKKKLIKYYFKNFILHFSNGNKSTYIFQLIIVNFIYGVKFLFLLLNFSGCVISGRLWGRSQCSTSSSGQFTCGTGDCASGQITCNGAGAVPPTSLVELTLASDGGQDFYDVSLVDGFNLPLSLTPQGGSGGCSSTSCSANVNSVCPPELAVKGSDGSVIACKSACLAFNRPDYCCTGSFGNPQSCPPSNYSKIFKGQCPQAYSYAYDDKSSTFTCSGRPNYAITFCP